MKTISIPCPVFTLAILVTGLCVAGLLAVAGPLGQDLAISWMILLVCFATVVSYRRCRMFMHIDRYARLWDFWCGRRTPELVPISPTTHVDSLAMAVDLAQRAENEAERRYGVARCAAEDVIRARAVRLQAEIALMRHRVTELQYSYRR